MKGKTSRLFFFFASKKDKVERKPERTRKENLTGVIKT